MDGDIESNAAAYKMILNLHMADQRKIKYLKEQQKSVILVRRLLLMLLVFQTCKMYFLMQFNLSA